MNLTLWNKRAPSASLNPFNGDLGRFRDEVDRTFNRFLTEPFGVGSMEPKSARAEGWLPAIDLSETDTEVTVRAEVPGIAGQDLEISLSGRVLTIAGQKDETSEKKEENYYHCERRFGSFRRAIDLPDTVDTEKVTAESDSGVVTVHVPKKPGAKPKHVDIKPASRKVALTV